MRKWLIAIRKKARLSQKYISERVGIAQASYCAIEKGKTTPNVSNAKAIADVLGFDWTRFYEEVVGAKKTSEERNETNE